MNWPQVYMCFPPSWTPLSPPSPRYPSGLSQSTGFGCPASYIELALIIYFTHGNVRVSMLFSQIIPPLPSPTASKVCSLHLCLLRCHACRIIVTVVLTSIYMHEYTVFVFLFLTDFTLHSRLQFQTTL